ncbi:cGMP-dependent protein kinase 2 isoform X1 [Periophthalmus magnuspinnatus]|uniref:cGMP-dependent protein kinase 2 isoform X1 n=1 Tax=Periophthalmus magnuspinnatus TaxID=409849 RepID=UPI00145B64C7|nr:cGMP-dependent protein kinase 2 isoform X1 [Periophthalmus magnuspinnatus]
MITEALLQNDFLKELDLNVLQEISENMYQSEYNAEDTVIQEGAPGGYLYVLTEGVLAVEQSGKFLGQMFPGTAFGELAILYNCKRTATVRAMSQSLVWALDRQSFQSIVRRTTQQRHLEHCSFLRSVSLLKDLPEDMLSRIADCLQVDYYDRGEYIIREGEEGDTFFIIAKGQVLVTQSSEGFTEPQEIKTLTTGEYFGEKALISEDVRSANVICAENDTQCLVLDRESFTQMVGTLEELQEHLRSYVEELSLNDLRRNRRSEHGSNTYPDPGESSDLLRLRDKLDQLRPDHPLDQLELIATLGMGGFGRVELVKLRDEERTFALKCIRKHHVVEHKQQEHVFSERNLLQQTSSAFIVRFFRTFRDQKFVYLLLEACLGGELWTVLRDMSYFDESTARFCCGCVLEALEFLHKKNIIYRDLKPENLLLDQNGYLKLTDFGFAKRLVSGRKTWTFCGTPEYVAPEVIMNRGHDSAVDLWAMGILLYELLTGSPPFSGPDPMKIYTSILRGVEKVDFPKKIRKRAEDLIRRLCRLNPMERLGNNKNGINDIKKHKWFQGFNWDGLRRRQLVSPLWRQVSGPTDHSHFDVFPPDTDMPPDELSGWDQDF